MARKIKLLGDPTAIGEVKTPPFARVPDPVKLFERRAARLRTLSGESGIGPYIGFLAELVAVQHRLAGELPPADAPDPEALARSLEFGMPPLDRNGFRPDAAFRSLTDRLFEAAGAIEKPPAAADALDRVRAADEGAFDAMVRNVLSDTMPVETLAEHVYVAAALQVHFTRAASALPERELKGVGDGVCPACGGAPMSSVIVGWPQAGGVRFCACSLCATLWHHVRVKCVLCSSTEGIGYQEIEDGPGTIKAETCDNCHTYLKIFNQQKDVSLEPLADDIGSLAIDLLMKGKGFRRGAFNPFLLGY